MESLSDIADFLRSALEKYQISGQELCERSGLEPLTIAGALNGMDDYVVTTLMALLDGVGYEVVFVPKPAAAGLGSSLNPFQVTEPIVKTGVQIAIDKIRRAYGEE